MRQLPAIALLVSCLVGCGQEPPPNLRVDIPVVTGDRALLLHVRGETITELHAVSISESGEIDPLSVPLPVRESVSLTALFYQQTLESMRIPSGLLTSAGEGRALPSAPRIERYEQMSLVDPTPGSWVPQTALPNDLEMFRLPALNDCGTFEPTVVSLGEAASPQLVLALDDRWVFVGTHSRTSFLVDAEGTVVRLDDLPSSFLAGYTETTGKIWLGGERGVVYEADFDSQTPSLTVTASSTTASGMPIWGLTGPANGTPNERFSLGWSPGVNGNWGSLEHFDGQDWWYRENRRDPHNVSYVQEGLALYATHFRGAQVQGVENREIRCTYVNALNFGNILELNNIPGLGLIAGGSGGELMRLQAPPTIIDCEAQPGAQDNWETLSIAPSSQAIIATHAYPSGLVFLSYRQGTGSLMTQYVEGQAPCAPHLIDRADLSLGSTVTVVGLSVVAPLVEGDPEDLNRAGLNDLKERFVAVFKAR